MHRDAHGAAGGRIERLGQQCHVPRGDPRHVPQADERPVDRVGRERRDPGAQGRRQPLGVPVGVNEAHHAAGERGAHGVGLVPHHHDDLDEGRLGQRDAEGVHGVRDHRFSIDEGEELVLAHPT